MINYKFAKKCCCEDISLIENYDKAATDTTQTWVLHHRKGFDLHMSKERLIENGLYWNRPADELCFMTKCDHMSLHSTYNCSGENNPMYGKNHSEESRKKISETRKERIAAGDIIVDMSKCHTEEANNKISEKAKERLKDPTKHPMYGKHMSEETKLKISEAKKGKIPWNKGLKTKKDA